VSHSILSAAPRARAMQRFKNSYRRFLYVRAAANARIGHLTDNGIEKTFSRSQF
jgi:hypothetical protein